ncbi:MAG: carboxylate-amine ligase [Hyphomicrobiaceae bacterium]|nr:carboxylate-amine ligase [Hyphomicrobiaceae bacterium]
MALRDPSFTFGIEEEYHLVDRATRDLAAAPQELMDACLANLGGQVSPEFLKSQIEIGTPVCRSFRDMRRHLVELRGTIGRIAASYGLAPMAASTHPFAHFLHQAPTDKARYKALAQDLQAVGRRLVVCGMHVHAGIEDDELRIDLMNQVRYFLPHLLILSTSSPFWEGENTGLKSYRLSVMDELPRTGMPGRLSGWDEYQQTVGVLVKAGVIEDATKIWWDLRPSHRFPTLEMRITDVCTRLDDAVSIAALFVCICRMLYRLRRANQSWRMYPVFLLEENRWRAQRYGVKGTLFDFGQGTLVPFRDLLGEIQALIAEDAAALGCESEVAHAGRIVEEGTSADRQVATCERLLAAGATRREALAGVVDILIAETLDGCQAQG